MRAIGARRNSGLFSRACPNISGCTGRNRQGFSVNLKHATGSKNRRLRQCKISICEVLISVTLSVYGEVVEWLKAAVC
jgi:hypothetical protein